MATTFVGQLVWFLTWDDKQGPYPAIVIRGGEIPLMAVFFAEGTQQVSASNWYVEDGTFTGWVECPADGVAPVDLFD